MLGELANSILTTISDYFLFYFFCQDLSLQVVFCCCVVFLAVCCAVQHCLYRLSSYSSSTNEQMGEKAFGLKIVYGDL